MGTHCGPDDEQIFRFHPLSGEASTPNATEFAFLTSLPTAKYSRVSEFFRKTTSGDGQCKFFCGGKKCKYENGETHWTEDQMAVKGLYSTWITDRILAMARPNTVNILKHDLIGQFKRFGIKTIINLQKPGEHPYCGHGLAETAGFSYDPQLFMDNGIFHYNFGWDDYGVASISTLLDMVRVFKFATDEGKVAVHCHAGLGRTGVLITCFLVYHWRISANRAIQHMRMNRPQAVQTRQQMSCVRSFAAFLRPLQVIFPHQHKTIPYEFTLSQFLRRQRYLLHGFEARYLHHVPKLVFVVGHRLVALVGAQRDSPLASKPSPADMESLIPRAFQGSRSRQRVKDSKEEDVDDDGENERENGDDDDDDALVSKSPGFDGIVALSNQDGNGTSSLAPRSQTRGAASPHAPVFEATHEFRQIVSGKNTPEGGYAPDDEITRLGQSRDREGEAASGREPSASPTLGAGKSSKVFGLDADPASLRQRSKSSVRSVDDTLPLAKVSSVGHRRKPTSRNVGSTAADLALASAWEDAAEALVKMCGVVKNGNAEEEGVAEVMKRVVGMARRLNDCDSSWNEVEIEKDPLLLSGLLWTWIDQLKEPILTRQDLNALISAASKPMEKILRKLDRGTRETIKHLVSIFAFMETGKSRRWPVDGEPPSVPVERIHLLLHLAEKLCHQDFTQPIKEFMDEAMIAATLERNAELSSTWSSTFVTSGGSGGRDARRPKAPAGGGGIGIPTLDRGDAVVVVMFVYRLFLFVARTHDLITDFDSEATYGQVVEQLFQLIEARTKRK